MNPKVIKGSSHKDSRGCLVFNNDFNTTEIKRIYFIQNDQLDFVRGWQGHQIEQRWFSVIQGSFKVCTRAIDNWGSPSKKFMKFFILTAATFDVLHIPNGYVTSIQALEANSKLMAMSDYTIGEIQDEYRFDLNHFK